jgi:hypothetical protein
MSTKIEDLSDNEEEYEYQDSEDNEVLEPFEIIKEDDSDINSRILKILYKKIKEPVLVVVIMLVLTHPLLIKGIFRIPNVEVLDGTLGVNVILSILAGIIFFIIREFV